MKVVILCTKYAATPDSPYLTDELANAIAEAGHQVRVLLADWANEHHGTPRHPSAGSNLELTVSKPVVVPGLPASLRRVVKWAFTSLRIAAQARRCAKDFEPDLVLAFSPLVALYAPVWFLTSSRVGRRFLVQWDFFPDAQVQIGLLSGPLKIRLLKAVESWLIRRFNVVGCMSPRNIEYLYQNFALTPGTQTVHLPLWSSTPQFIPGSRQVVRQMHSIAQDVHVFVFGGQLIAGRGIDDMLAAATRLKPASDRVLFLFMGQGPMATEIEAVIAAGNPLVKLLPAVPRRQYLSLISACDVGVVCTLRDVMVPTFPSKTVDYLQAGLPILASVEAATDYGDFIESNGLGVKVPAGDIDAFIAAVRKFCHAPVNSTAQAARATACLHQHFSVDQAKRIVLGNAG